jgi:hypothetical protein
VFTGSSAPRICSEVQIWQHGDQSEKPAKVGLARVDAGPWTDFGMDLLAGGLSFTAEIPDSTEPCAVTVNMSTGSGEAIAALTQHQLTRGTADRIPTA